MLHSFKDWSMPERPELPSLPLPVAVATSSAPPVASMSPSSKASPRLATAAWRPLWPRPLHLDRPRHLFAILKAATKALKRPLFLKDIPSFILAIVNLFVMFAPSALSPSQSWMITIENTREPNLFYVTYAAMLSDTKVSSKPLVLIQHNYFGPVEKLIRKKIIGGVI